MSGNSFFQGLLSSVFERGVGLTRSTDKRSMKELIHALVSGRGEVSGTKIAHALFNKYEVMSYEEREEFFVYLNEHLDVNTEAIIEAANRFSEDGSADNLRVLQKVSEPGRLELLRRLNGVPGGTGRLVRMREDFLKIAKTMTRLTRTDVDFQHLFTSWFNRGFLVLRPIDWTTPAHILEKVITYESVHEIQSWEDLRRRLLPEDRRCFAFFHPAMPDEPLIFVVVALTKSIPSSIQDVLAENREELREDEADTAVFYSISNCQAGLQGVSFGNFLIKQVVGDLAHDLPNLKTFVTLSPVPSFMNWLEKTALSEPDRPAEEALGAIKSLTEPEDLSRIESLKTNIVELAARYFLLEKREDGQPIDPVARFHLGNGASLRQINWMGDVSEKGLKQSAGLMVNYLYDLSDVEDNHEAYAQDRVVKAEKSIQVQAEKASKNISIEQV
ncbi:MAG: malonyl-CoA decarboxylase [Hyphomicrobiales bacterium]